MRGARDYRPDIDGLRAVAVLAVLFHHIWPRTIEGGFAGVDIFFVISGFLITRIITSEIKAGTFRFSRFYERRARRLLPALLPVLAVVVIMGWFFLLPSDYFSTLRATISTTFFSSNIVFWREFSRGYFAPESKLNPLLHTWSLGVEEQFYLLFPVVLVLCVRFLGGKFVPVLVAGALLSFVAAVGLLDAKPVAVFYLLPFRAWELLVGALLALGVFPAIVSGAGRSLLSLLGLAMLALAFLWLSPSTPFPGAAALLPVVGSAALIHAGSNGRPARWLQPVLESHTLVFVGLISYSLYLWHWPLIVFFKYLSGLEVGLWVGLLLAVVSIGLAALSYRFVELPFRGSGQNSRRGRLDAGIAAAGFVALAGVSVAGMMMQGVTSRFGPEVLALDRDRDPVIPYRACDGRASGCRIGDASKAPTVLFWGDSHMLAWAPAVEMALKRAGLSGLLFVNSACPPVAGVEVVDSPRCHVANQEIWKHLATGHHRISKVVFAANWRMYVKPGRIWLQADPKPDSNESDLLANALHETIAGLRALGLEVAVLGAVPSYSQDIPFELARWKAGLGGSYIERIYPLEDPFGSRLPAIALKGGAQFVDVHSAICGSECTRMVGGKSAYRDSGHLSVAGALAYSGLVAQVLAQRPKLIDRPSYVESTESRQ